MTIGWRSDEKKWTARYNALKKDTDEAVRGLQKDAQFGRDLAEALKIKARGWPADIDKIIPPRPREPGEPEHDSYIPKCGEVECGKLEGFSYVNGTCDYCPGMPLVDDNHNEWSNYRVKLAQWEKEYSELIRVQHLKKIFESACANSKE